MVATGKADRLKNVDGVSPRDMFRIDPRLIKRIDGWNVRDYDDPENQAHVRELAESIKVQGVLNPVVVQYKEGEILLLDGECRLRATLLAISEGADIQAIPAITEENNKYVTEIDRVFGLMLRNAGKNLTMLEKGEAFSRLLKLGLDEQGIAKQGGWSTQHVRDVLTLNAAPENVKAFVKKGSIAASAALQTVRKHGDKAKEVIEKTLEKTKKARVTNKNLASNGETSKPTRKGAAAVKPADAVPALLAALKDIKKAGSLAEAHRIAAAALENAGAA